MTSKNSKISSFSVLLAVGFMVSSAVPALSGDGIREMQLGRLIADAKLCSIAISQESLRAYMKDNDMTAETFYIFFRGAVESKVKPDCDITESSVVSAGLAE